MSYKDEELLRMRQKIELFKKEQTADNTIAEECKQSIHDPVIYITKIPVEFKDKLLMDGQIRMRVPADFEPMPKEVIDQVFYMSSKPQYVYETPYLPFGLSFTITDVEMNEEKLEQVYPYILSMLKKIGPGVRILSKEKKRVHDTLLQTTEFMAKTATEPTYNNQFICCLNGKMLAGNLMCTSAFRKRFKPIMEEMMETLYIPKPEEKEEERQ